MSPRPASAGSASSAPGAGAAADAGAAGGSASADAPDAELLARLCDLSLVELDALLAASGGGEHAARLLDAHIDDLADALQAARRRTQALRAAVASGPEPLALPLAWIEREPARRERADASAVARERAAALRERADACRALARLDQLCAALLPRLFEAEGRRHGQV